jgi:hypothetical protein
MLDLFLHSMDNRSDLFVYSLLKIHEQRKTFDMKDNMDFFPMVCIIGSGLIIGRHGYSGMGDFYSNTHGNTGMGFF